MLELIKKHLGLLGNSIYRNAGNIFILGFFAFIFESAYKGNYTVNELSYYFLTNLLWFFPTLLFMFYIRVFLDSKKLNK